MAGGAAPAGFTLGARDGGQLAQLRGTLAQVARNTHTREGTMEGKVKWFDAQKGYGFITAEGSDYFCHHSDIEGTGYKLLEEGEAVTFAPAEGEKGAYATKVSRQGGF